MCIFCIMDHRWDTRETHTQYSIGLDINLGSSLLCIVSYLSYHTLYSIGLMLSWDFVGFEGVGGSCWKICLNFLKSLWIFEMEIFYSLLILGNFCYNIMSSTSLNIYFQLVYTDLFVSNRLSSLMPCSDTTAMISKI